jgi:hypothetical protein
MASEKVSVEFFGALTNTVVVSPEYAAFLAASDGKRITIGDRTYQMVSARTEIVLGDATIIETTLAIQLSR